MRDALAELVRTSPREFIIGPRWAESPARTLAEGEVQQRLEVKRQQIIAGLTVFIALGSIIIPLVLAPDRFMGWGFRNYAFPALCVVALLVLIVGAGGAIAAVKTKGFKRRVTAEQRASLPGELRPSNAMLAVAFQDWATRNGLIGHTLTTLTGETLFYSALGLAATRPDGDRIVVFPVDVLREVTVGRSTLAYAGTVQGEIGGRSGSALGGAAIGGLIFGPAGAVVGAVASGGGKRQQNATLTMAQVSGVDLVDIYTRVPEFPRLKAHCASEDEAKHLYGVLAAAIEQRAGERSSKRIANLAEHS